MRSWGGLPEQPQQLQRVHWSDQLPALWRQSTLPVGCGRSYGDSGLAASGLVLQTTGLNRLLAFDRESGILRCEAGVTLGEILRLAIPAGWILPVLPGTQFVTVAGAVANDVHGKNHHQAATFGAHLRCFELRRSDGASKVCSATENAEWFAATIAGLGMTGIITWVELQLRPVPGPWLHSETIKFRDLTEFFALCEESVHDYHYTVAWIDCLSRHTRGHFTRAGHSESQDPLPARRSWPAVPFSLPLSPLNGVTLRMFNSVYYHRQRQRQRQAQEPWQSWFFPLDGVGHWNRLYGRRGFRQYQCVVPHECVAELLALVRSSGQGSMLAVLKTFGELPSPGLLSFPRAGATLALDFPWRAERTLDLFARLDAVVYGNGGAVYPAKDGHMQAQHFRQAYPAWEAVEALRDPQINSQFWQRVTGAE